MIKEVAGIYVINLDSRPERWELFQQGTKSWEMAFGKIPEHISAIKGINLPGYDKRPWFTQRISGKRKKSWGGKAGCILSHRSAIKKAEEQRWPNVLILEDDAFLSEDACKAWITGLKQLIKNLPEDWSTINFCSTIPIPPCRIVSQYKDFSLVEASGAFGAVAYLLNGKILPQILKELPDKNTIWAWVARHKTIDRWYSKNLIRFGKVYLFAPSVVGHRTGSSDTSMSQENDWLLDFSLKNVKYAPNLLAFEILKTFRRLNNYFCGYSSFIRLGIKRLRGL